LLNVSWQAFGDIEVENTPPRSAMIKGNVSPYTDAFISYEISHPRYLFGTSSFTQKLQFCPHPPEPLPEEEMPPWYSNGGDNENLDENKDYYNEHWCCHWGLCDEWCICGCDCASLPDNDQNLNENFDDICPVHNSAYNECASLHEDEYMNVLHMLQHLGGVLYIRDPPQYEKIQLDVPTEFRTCCPCPDHWTNYVGLVYKSYRLSLVDENAIAFCITNKSCSINLAGIHPSSQIGDATLVFSRNGEIYKQADKTVLGVAIKSSTSNLNVYNTLNGSFGCPMTICTNVANAINLNLVTNVKLSSGKIHLELAETTGKFIVWYYDSESEKYRKLLDSETMPVKDLSFEYWRKIMKRASIGNSAKLPIFVTSSEPGRTKLIFRYWNVIDGKFVEDTAEQYISSLLPPLRTDLTRNGAIDNDDIKAILDGCVFRYWTNEDRVKGDFVGEDDNDEPNIDDLVVNGTYDLVNFFPIALDFQQFKNAWGDKVRYIVRASWDESPSFNFCFANLPWIKAGSIQTTNVTTISGNALKNAQLVPLSCEGIELSRDLLSQFSQNSGAMICEALKPDGAIYVEVRLGDELLYSYSVPIRVSSVRNMYRWMNLRYVVGDNSGESSKMWEPDNYPDEECDGKHFVFVHGYNVNASGARIWADAIFKRLWLAGSKSKFTAVDWRGDESQIYVPTQGDVSPNYYINVRHAFMTAEQAATNINALSGEKIILAHSLGNMLVSSAAKDYGLVYSKYYMINAAVPMEAYDATANNALMIDGAWKDMPIKFRASRWSTQFSQSPYENDFRGTLSWRGRFAGIQNAINCYSPTEDVLKNPKVNKIFGMSAGSDFGGAWSQQELFKGCALWYGVNSIAFSGAEIEGGWGINARYMVNPLAYIPLSGFNPSYFSEYTREDLITKPLFTSMNDDRMSSTNELNFVDANLRAKMLGDAIPAESFAAGANETGGGVLNYNMQIDTPNGWPSQREKNTSNGIIRQWLHSDLKNVSFFYVFRLFNKIINEE
jgi:pimeloyl-ACP methyl ester carboxylesterase